MSNAIHPADVLVILAYLVAVVGIGVWFMRQQATVKDYFLAGRKMGFFAVSISIVASLLSAITYMGAPGLAYKSDLQYSLWLFCIPLVTPVLLVVFLPFFRGLDIYTAYEYLERRFNLPLRSIGSLSFILWRLGWMGLVIFAPALAASEFFGVPWEAAVLIMGLLATAYTVMGGIEAVIWTDVIQFIVLFGGVILVGIMVIAGTDGGFGALWQAAMAGGKLRVVDLSLDKALTEMTVWGVMLGGAFSALTAYSTDQVAIQRYLTTKSYAEARRTLIFHACVIVPISIVFYWVGTALWAYYHLHPEVAPAFPPEQADRILPYFVANQMPVGIRGLILAALFAATMSSIDSGINSITTTTLVDIYERLFGWKATERRRLAMARMWTLIWGGLATALAIVLGAWGKGLMEKSVSVASWFSGPLLGIFLLGMITRRANARGTLIGAAVGFPVVVLIAFKTDVTWLWYNAIGTLVTFVVGYVASFLLPPPPPEKVEGLVYEPGMHIEDADEKPVGAESEEEVSA